MHQSFFIWMILLENIKQGREEVDITFGCILDETIEPDRIDLFVYKS